MLERTKAHPTESVELRFVVPAAQAEAVRRAVAPSTRKKAMVLWSCSA